MDPQKYVSPEGLDTEHHAALQAAVNNVIDTERARKTFAQIVDGLPLRESAYEQLSYGRVQEPHPINLHTSLCPGVEERIEQLRTDFSIDILHFKSQLLHAYQSAPLSTRRFSLRLIELVASAIHEIAVLLFNLNLNMHDVHTTEGARVQDVTKWEPEQEPDDPFPNLPPLPTLFTHVQFTAQEQYPNGIADMVGYWAEDRIFGGVALFHHPHVWNTSRYTEPNLYLQSGHRKDTYRIWQLLDEQQEQFVSFLTCKVDTKCDPKAAPAAPWFLPFRSSRRNRVRIDPMDAIHVARVYRDEWERRYIDPWERQLASGRCTRPPRPVDYPELFNHDGRLAVEYLKRQEEASSSSRPPESSSSEK